MSASYRLSAATGLHPGDRPYQQDQVLVQVHPRVAGCVLGVVADGMGGRSGGRKAADQVMLVAQQLFDQYQPSPGAAPELLTQLVQQSHLMIRLTAITAEQEPHSTLAAFLLHGLECHIVHAGDSRVHVFRQGALLQRTVDHSYVQQLVDAGMLLPEQAEQHPHANYLTGCLGAQREPPLALASLPLQPGDALLACSDGLWHGVGTDEMGALLCSLPAREAGALLVQRAHERAHGRSDNICLAIVRIDAPGEG